MRREVSAGLDVRIFASFDGDEGVSLAGLAHSLLDRQKEQWPQLRLGYAALEAVRVRRIEEGDFTVVLQHNPVRMNSTGANVDPAAIKARPCFLCNENLPEAQQAVAYRRNWFVLCNPYPIFSGHFTIAHSEHIPQAIGGAWSSCLHLARDFQPDYALLYNGPECGASAPDHLHFQAVPKTAIPVLDDKIYARKKALSKDKGLFMTTEGERPAMIVEGGDEHRLVAFLRRIAAAMGDPSSAPREPMMNLLCLYGEGKWRVFLFPRCKHRPEAYYRAGDGQILVSPGAVDMAGLLIVPREEDFVRLDAASVRNIYREVACPGAWIETIAAAL